MTKKLYLHIKHNVNGSTFKIPVANADEFLKDMQPVNEPAKVVDQQAEDHDDWYNRTHAFDEVNHIPETYK